MTGGQGDTITTAEELEALPVESVVLATGEVFQRWNSATWYGIASDIRYWTTDISLPATVLYRPDRPTGGDDHADLRDLIFRHEYIDGASGTMRDCEGLRDAILAAGFSRRPTGVSREQIEALIALVQGSPTVDRKCAGDGTADLHYIVCADEFDLAVLGLHPEEE